MVTVSYPRQNKQETQTALRWLCDCFSPFLGSRSNISLVSSSVITWEVDSMACTPHNHLLANPWSIPVSKHLFLPGFMLCICSLTSDEAMSQNTHCKLRISCQNRMFYASHIQPSQPHFPKCAQYMSIPLQLGKLTSHNLETRMPSALCLHPPHLHTPHHGLPNFKAEGATFSISVIYSLCFKTNPYLYIHSHIF